MPLQIHRPCAQPGCKCAVTQGRWCAGHSQGKEPKAWASNEGKTAASRGYGRAWATLREGVLRRDPFCVVCKARPSAFVDHKLNKARGGTDARDNLQGLCGHCHEAKTRAEAAEGKRQAAKRRRGGGGG